MSLIYITEPGHTGGVGAIGMRVLVQSLRSAGHDVTRVRLFKAQSEADEQGSLFARDTEKVVDHTWLAKPAAWFVSVLYVRQYIDLRDMFARVGVPMRTEDRSPSDPLIAFGGQFSIAPEPLCDFADIIALGDGELTGGRIADLLAAGAQRLDIMRELAGQPGYYVPSAGVAPFSRWESDTYTAITIEEGKTPTIELARGCASKCAFCRIGWAGGTYREAPQDQVKAAVALAGKGKANLFAPDYSSVSWVEDLEAFTEAVGCRNTGRDARADAAHKHLKSGRGVKQYSFGVEGVSERLRAAVGKPLKAEKLIETMSLLGAAGVGHVKWYMLFGLPGESQRDHDEFYALLGEVRKVYGGALNIMPSQAKGLPHTPLERISNHYQQDAHDRYQSLRAWCKERWSDQKRLVLAYKGRELHEHDCALIRGTREAARYIETAKESWVASGRWRDSLDESVLDEIQPDAHTSWDHVVAGPPRELRDKALATYWRTMRRSALPLAPAMVAR